MEFNKLLFNDEYLKFISRTDGNIKAKCQYPSLTDSNFENCYFWKQCPQWINRVFTSPFSFKNPLFFSKWMENELKIPFTIHQKKWIIHIPIPFFQKWIDSRIQFIEWWMIHWINSPFNEWAQVWILCTLAKRSFWSALVSCNAKCFVETTGLLRYWIPQENKRLLSLESRASWWKLFILGPRRKVIWCVLMMMFVKSLLTLRLLASGAMHTVVHFFTRWVRDIETKKEIPKIFVSLPIYSMSIRDTPLQRLLNCASERMVELGIGCIVSKEGFQQH